VEVAPVSAGEADNITVADPDEGDLGSTASALTQDYKKWETFDDEYNDIDELSDEDTLDCDLDALTGPSDEIARIHKHWKRETAGRRRAARSKHSKPLATAMKTVPTQSLQPAGPIVQRPCEYRPPSDKEAVPARAINREYAKWKTFDADAALLELDNEGKTEEGNAMRCEARKGSAVLSTEGYTKDREEYDIDEELEQQMGGLKKSLAQRAKDAAGFKAEGNRLLREGRARDACTSYERGLDMMELCQQATVIMSDSLADKNVRLIADLHRNLAAAQLAADDFEGALASSNAALRSIGDDRDDEKARYRRATALLRLGRVDEARPDIDSLVAARGEGDEAVRRLRTEVAKVSPVVAKVSDLEVAA